jgi:mannose-6-phosphate isomerase-like protein (cupin superfamily)
MKKTPVIKQRSDAKPIDCPFGHVQRIVTGGEGGVANVHVVRVTQGLPHVHAAYDEVYYFLAGTGEITVGSETQRVTPGTTAVIPAGVPHSLSADSGDSLEFVIFGTPAMAIDDPRAAPQRVTE